MSALPRGWVEDEASTICELVQSGGTPKEGFIDKPGVPFLKVYNIVDQKIDFEYRPQFIDVEIHRSSMAKSQAFPGDVLMNIVGPPLGKVAVIPDSFPTWNVNQALTIFRPSEALTSEWLYYFLCGGDSVKSVINETRGSAGQVNISLSQCRAFKLPLPPLAEQKRIVAKLDALNAKSARARTELARIETLVSRYKQAVLSKAFSGELTREWRQRQATSTVERTVASQSKPGAGSGRVAKVGASLQEQRDLVWNCPSSWCWDQVGNCAFVTKLAGFEYTKHVVYDPGGDLRVIKAENAGPEGFRRTGFSRIDTKAVSMLGRSKLMGGELLVVFVGAGTGNVAVVPNDEEFFLGPNIAMARPDPEKVSSAYLENFFRSNGGKSLLLAATKAVAQPSLSMGAIRATPVALPPIQEQHEIVRRIESAFAKIDRLAKEAKRALELVGRLDEAVLAKAFRGELVPQDENDEPAELLLARIRAEREAAPKGKRRLKNRA